MNKKKGKACSYIKPGSPEEAVEADEADPGLIAEIKAHAKEMMEGKYGSEKAEPFKGPDPEQQEQTETTWIEIELLDEEDEPVAGERYEITLPDGKVAKGSTNGDGYARVEGFEPGQCEVKFPNLDKDSWEAKS